MLFDHPFNPTHNLLPKNGTVQYYGKVFSEFDFKLIDQNLIRKINWQHDELIMFDNHIITKRKVAWYGVEPFSYTYSKNTKKSFALDRFFGRS